MLRTSENFGTAMYPGKMGTIGIAVYMLHDSGIYFTGITPSVYAGGTINQAEDIIRDICKQRNVTPFSQPFFDIQTWRGYGGKTPGFWQIDRLEIVSKPPSSFTVESWDAVARWRFPRFMDDTGVSVFLRHTEDEIEQLASGCKNSDLAGVPDEVLKTFACFLEVK